MKITRTLALITGLVSLSLPACDRIHAEEKEHQEHQKIVTTSPKVMDVTVTQQYVCQIRSQRSIEVCPLVGGRLEEIMVKEGEWVKQGDPMFRILKTLYQARLDAELAKVQVAYINYINAERLYNEKPPVISQVEVSLKKAELAEAQAIANRTKTEVDFTVVRAAFDGIVDRLQKQLGSTVKEGEVLTTMTDNHTMWVYFNVPESRYLEYKASLGKDIQNQNIELELANGNRFPHKCSLVTPLGKFNNETGNIPFRADFQNPDSLLRHGQTGNILIHRVVKGIVIPQRATFEVLDKQYVFIVGDDHIVHQRLITIEFEKDDIFVIKSGIGPKDKIVLEGVRQVHEGMELHDSEYRKPEEVIGSQKTPAE